ncbi:KN motif and ankyrin repeat domain-containing protein 4-like [Hippocampus zosterae]|uniref:KN motif and ankyrin repeat domain-containing protein 4-like n=1 Tax=Hippocampus zosterae TaxID=109293 RepID=UPI00223D924B|nr:KN motif and ankyrin repeat domain-containing protein 4-like [Hippocampus zosterae]
MDRYNGNMQPTKASESGIKGNLPYSVETPYGFRLDLDFLKYVDDIEKGRTIKRISIQRHSKGPRASTLPRHPNTSGYGYRPSPWGSTGALGPRSRLSDDHHHSSTPWLYDHRSPISPRGRAEIEAKIRAFDEQPLGEHIRPHLLRASSLPLTVLLRQGLEAMEEPASLRSSRGHLGDRNKSCEDILDSPENPHTQDCSGLLRRLRDALEHVEELEREVRVIPDLRAQICQLQEEKETLRSQIQPLSYTNGTHDNNKNSRYERCTRNSRDDNPTHEWRMSTDLDELLTVTSLQAKVAMLEQKLHETELDLQRAAGRLRQLQKASKDKDEEIERLVTNSGVWLQAERVVVDQEADESTAISKSVGANGQNAHLKDDVESPESCLPTEISADTSVVIQHINKIKRLLDQQWECLSAAEEEKRPKVISLQQEMMGLVDILACHYTQLRNNNGYALQHGGGKCAMKNDGDAWTSNTADEGYKKNACDNPVGQDYVPQMACGLEQEENSIRPQEMAATQVEAERQKTGTEEKRQVISHGNGSGRTDGGAASVEADAIAEMANMKSQLTVKQKEGDYASKTTTQSSETVNADFMSACRFLNEHMDNIENPTNDTRRALVVLFQDWFSTAAEENSMASKVNVYLGQVKKATPSLLAFLINLADDNGNTVLHYSVSHCKYDIVSLLLDTGVSDVNFQNEAGYTAAMLASLTAPDNPGDMEVVRRLMELGNMNIRSRQTGQTALHLAVRHGRVVMVRLLLSCGADANIRDAQGTTALMFASERGYTHIARLLLERTQCDLTLTDQSGRTALSIAMLCSHSDTAALLQAHAKARAQS